MSNRRKIKKLKKRMFFLESMLKSSSLTLTDPDSDRKKIVFEIKDGLFTVNEVIYPVALTPEEPTISNITQKEM